MIIIVKNVFKTSILMHRREKPNLLIYQRPISLHPIYIIFVCNLKKISTDQLFSLHCHIDEFIRNVPTHMGFSSIVNVDPNQSTVILCVVSV